MATVVKGARTTTSGIASTRLIVQMGDLYKLEDDQGALYVTASKYGKKKMAGFEQKWHTSELRPKFDAVNNATGYASGATSIAVDNVGYHQKHDLVKVTRTGEVLLVTAVNTGGAAIEVTRSWGATAAAALNDDDELLILGPAYPENATLQDPRSVTEVAYSNYIQLWRDSFEISGTLQAITNNGGTYHGSDEETLREDMLLTHKRNINLTGLFGEKNATGNQRSTDGIIPFIKTNAPTRVDSTSAFTEAVWNTVIRKATRYGSKDKLAICSRQFVSFINQHALGNQRVTPGDDMYGLRVMNYTSPFGNIKLVVDDALEGTEYSQYAVLLDIGRKARPKMAMLRDTRVIKGNRVDDGSQDGYEEEVLTEGTIELGNPSFHFLVDNANSAS